MGFFKETKPKAEPEKKKVQLKKNDICCCQCHRKISECYVKPEKEEAFKDIFMVCPACFIEIAQAVDYMKKQEMISKEK
jgi:hypothetical protein